MMTGILLMSVAPCLIADCLLNFFFQVGESCSYSADSLRFLSVPRQCLLKKRVVMCSVIVSLSYADKFGSHAMAQAVGCWPHHRGPGSIPDCSVWELPVLVQVIFWGEINPFISSCLTHSSFALSILNMYPFFLSIIPFCSSF